MNPEEKQLCEAELRLKRLNSRIRSLREDLSDIKAIVTRRKERPVPWNAFMERLRRSGIP